MPSRVQIDITAQDNASATLDSVRSKLQLFDQFGRQVSDLSSKVDAGSKSFTEFDLSASKAARGVRSLAGPIAAELSPALGQTASQMAGVIATSAAMGSGMAALGLAAATLAGIVGAKLAAAWEKSREEMTLFQRVLASSDIERTSGLIDTLSKKVTDLSETLREFRRRAAPEGGVGSGEEAGFGQFLTGLSQKDLDKALEQARALREAREKLRDVEVPGGTNADQNAALAANARAVFEAQQAQRGLSDFFQFGTIEQTNREMLRKAADLEAAGLTDAAAKQRKAAEDRRLFDEAALLGREGTDVGQGFEQATAGAESTADKVARIAIEAKAALQAIKELREQLEIDVVPGAQMEEVVKGLSLEDVLKGHQRTVEELERQLIITQQLGLLTSQRTDLTLQQREALSLETIEMERILKLQIAGTDQAKLFAAEIEAALKRQQVLEASNPLAGFRRGLTDVEVEFGSAGLRMQETARTVGGDIARALSDSMLAPFEERLKGLPPLFRTILTSMLRAVTDDIGKAITAQLFSGIKGLLPGGGTPGLTPFDGAGSGGGPAGGITNVTLNVAGRPLPESELRTAFEAGGEAGVRALRSGSSTGDILSGDVGRQPFNRAAMADPSASIASTRSFFDSALPIAGNAAALGLTAFSAQGARTGFDVGASGALGALTGAGLGRSIGNLFGDSGGSVGAGTGALAGAAINTTLALLAKQAADKEAQKQRQAAEIARAAGAGSDLVSSAGQARSLPDLFRRITAFGSGSTGGSANPAVPVSVDTPTGPKTIGYPNPTYPTATLSDLLANPGSLKAGIQAGVDPGQLSGPNAATSTALQKIATDMVEQFRKQEQGIGVTEEDLMMPSGLRRRTTVPLSRASALGGGGDLEIDELALNELSDDDRAAALLDLLGQTAQDRDIVSTISDGATGKIVSITRIPRSTIALPPATTPPPAPVTPSGTTPPAAGPGTAETVAAGSAIAIGLAGQLLDPNSTIRQLLPTNFTPSDVSTLFGSLFSPSAGAFTTPSGALTTSAPEILREAQFLGENATSSVAATPGFGAGDALGAVGGILALVQGAESGDPLSIIQGAYSLYSASVAALEAGGVLAQGVLPTLSTLTGPLAEGIIAIAPELATSLIGSFGATAVAEGAAPTAAALAPALGAIAGAAAPLVAAAVAFIFHELSKQNNTRQQRLMNEKVFDQWAAGLNQATTLYSQLGQSLDPDILQSLFKVGSSAQDLFFVSGDAGGFGYGDMTYSPSSFLSDKEQREGAGSVAGIKALSMQNTRNLADLAARLSAMNQDVPFEALSGKFLQASGVPTFDQNPLQYRGDEQITETPIQTLLRTAGLQSDPKYAALLQREAARLVAYQASIRARVSRQVGQIDESLSNASAAGAEGNAGRAPARIPRPVWDPAWGVQPPDWNDLFSDTQGGEDAGAESGDY